MLMQVVCIAGIAVSYCATNYGMILGGRMIVQAFVGWDTLLVPMYSAELAPARIRGAMVGLFVFSHQFGAFICSFVTYSSSTHTHSNYSWQLPLAIGFIFPGLMFIFGWFIPESPRWLVRKQKPSQAEKNLKWIMGSTPNFDAPHRGGPPRAESRRGLGHEGLLGGPFQRHKQGIVTPSWPPRAIHDHEPRGHANEGERTRFGPSSPS